MHKDTWSNDRYIHDAIILNCNVLNYRVRSSEVKVVCYVVRLLSLQLCLSRKLSNLHFYHRAVNSKCYNYVPLLKIYILNISVGIQYKICIFLVFIH